MTNHVPTKESLIRQGQQWVSDLLYETGNVHQREKHVYDKAENKIEDLISQAHTAGRKEREEEIIKEMRGQVNALDVANEDPEYVSGFTDAVITLTDIKSKLADNNSKDAGFFRSEDNEPMWRNEDGTVEEYQHQDGSYGGPMCTFRWCKCKQ